MFCPIKSWFFFLNFIDLMFCVSWAILIIIYRKNGFVKISKNLARYKFKNNFIKQNNYRKRFKLIVKAIKNVNIFCSIAYYAWAELHNFNNQQIIII